MTESTRHYVVCIRNDGYEESLDVRKIYEVLADDAAARRGMMRVVDEEQEDYLYPAEWFLTIELPQNIEAAIADLPSRTV